MLELLVQNAMSLVPNDILVKNYGQLTLEEIQLVNAAVSSYTADIMGMAEWCPSTMPVAPFYFMIGKYWYSETVSSRCFAVIVGKIIMTFQFPLSLWSWR